MRSAICARVDSASHANDLCRRRFPQDSSVVAGNKRQGSSVVEQGTHKPLVGSSTLPPGIPRLQID
jgi:hypothetical protein